MDAGKFNMLCEQGATFDFNVVWKDALHDLVNLTGITARMQVRSTFDSNDIIIELTTENGRISLNETFGVFNLLIDCDDTAALPDGTFKYDLEVQFSNGDCHRLLKGNFKVDPEVTR
ncbi:MAG: hypothetical protein ACWGQW_08480 [bacterium]